MHSVCMDKYALSTTGLPIDEIGERRGVVSKIQSHAFVISAVSKYETLFRTRYI